MDASECKEIPKVWLSQLLTSWQGFTTAAQKLNRKVIVDRYKKEIEQAYSGSG